MKIKFILLIFSLCFIGSVYADFNDGNVAFNKGDYQTAYKEWLPLAEQGHDGAQASLGWMYEHGKGVDMDTGQAIRFYEKAGWNNSQSPGGHIGAQHNLGLIYYYGHTKNQDSPRDMDIRRDLKKAFSWFYEAARNEYAAAQYYIGLMFAEGQAYPNNSTRKYKSLEEAAYWTKLAYENGSEEAENVWNEYELWKY